MFRKLILTLAATAALGAVMHTKSAYAVFKDTCGTPSSIAGCKTGDCYGGDRLGADGLWHKDGACGARANQNPKGDAAKNKMK
jgi:hypothetical protein